MSLDEQIGTFISLKFDVDTDEFSDGTLERYTATKEAILKDLLDIIGEDEKADPADMYLSLVGTRNQLRQELREAVRKYCD